MRSLNTPVGVLFVALVIGVLTAVRLLAVFDWDPTVFTAFGEESTAITEYAENKLGREVLTRPHQGHDGKFFFVQANDPWLLEPAENAAVLDRPEYRSRRMLYPLLAGGLGAFGAQAIVWVLPAVNVIMIAMGSWATAHIARHHGVPAWIGIAFALNIGLMSELFIDGAGITAYALAALGALSLEKGQWGSAAALLVGSVLTREVMALFVAFVALMWLIRKRELVWRLAIPPAVALLAWEAYLRFGVDLPEVPNQANALAAVPFRGLWEAITSGHANSADYAVIGLFVALLIVVPYRAFRSNVYLTWGSLGFAFLAPFLTVFVWQKSFDISRALAPLITVFVLEMFISRSRRREDLGRTGVRPAS